MRAYDIEWSVDIDDIDIYEIIENKDTKEAAKKLGIPYIHYIGMTASEIEDYVYNQSRRNPYFLGELIGLPSSVELPDVFKDIEDDEYTDTISEWLSDTYGFCVSYYELEDNE